MNIKNVDTFRGFNVVNGQVDVSEDQYVEWLDDVYPETVEACGMTFTQSRILQELDAVAFRCGLADFESEIQSELEEAIENEDNSEIEWLDAE
jgi:hypothetical protein